MSNHQNDRRDPDAPASGRGERRASELLDSDFALEKKGNNQLRGNDQLNAPSERKAVPDVKQDTDGLIESFEKTDKDVRARTDLGKGNRHGRH
jgi:hypothetical protein